MPHGVFEIPALLLAASYGLWLVVMVVRRMRGKESTLLRFYIEHAFRRYFAIVFPLLIVAAAIETALLLKLGKDRSPVSKRVGGDWNVVDEGNPTMIAAGIGTILI